MIIILVGSGEFIQSVMNELLRSALAMVGTFRLQVWICKAALLVLCSIHDSSYLHG